MACGVQYIHSQSVVHRDIKPSNVLVSKSDTNSLLKISGFGLSKDTSGTGCFSLSGVRGTHIYMAPEMLKLSDRSEGLARGSLASDVFSLGCVFFYFITRGLHPFGDGYHTMIKIITGNAVNLHSTNHYALFDVLQLTYHFCRFEGSRDIFFASKNDCQWSSPSTTHRRDRIGTATLGSKLNWLQISIIQLIFDFI